MKARTLLNSIFATIIAIGACPAHAAVPSGYYSSCENKGGDALLKALCSKVGPHTTVSYDGLWNVYKTSDITASGKIWDMYSTKEWPLNSQRCGNYKLVGDCYNREHSFPKSWFNDAKPMYSDAFHLYPTDGKVNGQRSNFPYGECEGGTTLPSNGSVKALGRLGTSTFPGYSGKVFEPVDEYKGDFARSYFYMAAAYNDRIATWNSDMLAGNSYPVFSSWAINLLMKWHRQDPVSQKELDRNEAVYAHQKNRNPFIDHPEMAEYIWGNKTGERWSSTVSSDPEFILPVKGSTVDFGNVGVGVSRNTSVTVKTTGMSSPVSVSVSGAGFSTSTTQIAASSANSTDGAQLTIACKAVSAGTQQGTLTLTCGDKSVAVALRASAFDGIPASAPSDITDCSFVAHWTYVGNEDNNGCYTLSVFDNTGNAVDTYPRSVPALVESYLVDELASETAYTYQISCSGLKSNVISVSTSAPVPSIQILYDGDLMLESEPGTPSEAAELLLDIENISQHITLSVAAPFELSSDKGNWSRSISISPEEDRFYLRVNSDKEGSFSTAIKAVAGDYVSDDAIAEAHVSSTPAFIEDFEANQNGNYSSPSVAGTAANWLLSDAGVFNVNSEAGNGSNYLRMGKSAASVLTLDEDRPHGIGTVSFLAAGWINDGESVLAVEISSDHGTSWENAGNINIAASTSSIGQNYKTYSIAVNRGGELRLRLRQISGKRLGIDDLSMSNYTSDVIEGVESDYRSWDAYCRDGQLVVELSADSKVAVYGVDGITYHSGLMKAGLNRLDLPCGLYIVAVADFTRRVLVK